MINYSDVIIRKNQRPRIPFYLKNKKLLGGSVRILQGGEVLYTGNLITKYNEIFIDLPFANTVELVIELSKGDIFQTFPILIFCLEFNDFYVICDIDFTISATSVFKYIRDNILPMKIITHSVDILNKLISTYKIIYLTGRHSRLTKLSRLWLKKNSFPIGPIIARTMETSFQLTNYKINALNNIVSISTNGIGIGDLKSDIKAYQAHKLIAVKIRHPILKNNDTYIYKKENYYQVKSWKGIERLFHEKFGEGVKKWEKH